MGNFGRHFFKLEKNPNYFENFEIFVKKHQRGEAFFSRLKKAEIFLRRKKEEILLQIITFEKEGIFLQSQKNRKSF